MTDLLNVEAALERILAVVAQPKAELVSLGSTLGRVLMQDALAKIDLPPFPNCSMDGYAVRSADVGGASDDSPVSLRRTMDIPAGTAPVGMLGPGETARIMTGAPVPDGADAVVPVEWTDADWRNGSPEAVQIRRGATAGVNIRQVGENVRIGDVVLRMGTVLRPQDIGMLAGLGQAEVTVYRRPKVVILTTGDELVGVDEPLTPGKIRDTNSYTLAGLVSHYGGIPVRLPKANDTLDAVRALFQQALAEEPDVIVSSAGVSVGGYDVVRTVLDELGEVNFWRVNVRPGKPLAFGLLRGIPFFGLPGNPVSAMVTFDLFVRPVLQQLGGLPDDATLHTAEVGEPMTSDGRRTYVRVRLQRVDGRLLAFETGTQSSGALMSMVLADGLLIIPEDTRDVARGTTLPVRLLRGLV